MVSLLILAESSEKGQFNRELHWLFMLKDISKEESFTNESDISYFFIMDATLNRGTVEGTLGIYADMQLLIFSSRTC